MNRWGLMSALALAAALLLMGCRETEKQTDMAEEHPITYEDVCERNTISALLERHEVVTIDTAHRRHTGRRHERRECNGLYRAAGREPFKSFRMRA